MLRRLVLTPALVALAMGTAAAPAPAEAYEVICLDLEDLEIILEAELPREVPVFPKTVCVPWLLPFLPPPGN